MVGGAHGEELKGMLPRSYPEGGIDRKCSWIRCNVARKTEVFRITPFRLMNSVDSSATYQEEEDQRENRFVREN